MNCVVHETVGASHTVTMDGFFIEAVVPCSLHAIEGFVPITTHTMRRPSTLMQLILSGVSTRYVVV
jgi:hypothetical protein